eukprot:5521253-Amphidinium_carterae.2
MEGFAAQNAQEIGRTSFEAEAEEGEDVAPSKPTLVYDFKISIAILACALLMATITLMPMTWVMKSGDVFKYRLDLSRVTVESAGGALPETMTSFASERWSINDFKVQACSDERAKAASGFYHEACLMWEHMERDSTYMWRTGLASVALLKAAAALHMLLSFKSLP